MYNVIKYWSSCKKINDISFAGWERNFIIIRVISNINVCMLSGIPSELFWEFNLLGVKLKTKRVNKILF